MHCNYFNTSTIVRVLYAVPNAINPRAPNLDTLPIRHHRRRSRTAELRQPIGFREWAVVGGQNLDVDPIRHPKGRTFDEDHSTTPRLSSKESVLAIQGPFQTMSLRPVYIDKTPSRTFPSTRPLQLPRTIRQSPLQNPQIST